MKLKTRIMSAVLACMMLVSLLPVTALAADEHTPHDYSVYISTLDPGNCKDGTPGIAKYKCSGCTKTSYKSIDAEHTKGDNPTIVGSKEATCGVDGYTTYKCSTCGDPFDEVEKATGKHTETEGVIAATCTAPQKVGKKCSVCGIQLGEAVDVENSKPLGHNYQMTVTVEPKCPTDGTAGVTGSQRPKCTRCGEFDPDTPATPIPGEHDWVEDLDEGKEGFIAATCDHPGLQAEKCSRCSAKRQTVIGGEANPTFPKLSHKFDASKEAKTAATCTEPAYISQYCTVCKQTIKTIDTGVNSGNPLGHDWDSGESVAPNCKEGGYTLKTCQRENCPGFDSTDGADNKGATGQNEDGKAIQKTATGSGADTDAHVFSKKDSILLQPDDCSTEQNAIYKAKCGKCGASMGYVSVPYEHKFADNAVVTPKEDGGPTCTAPGKGTKECSECHNPVEVEMGATGHAWQALEDEDDVLQQPGENGWVVIKAATCGATGLKSRDCANCDADDKANEEIPISGVHHYVTKSIDATCRHGKQFGDFCEVCGEPDPEVEPFDDGKIVGHVYVVKEQESTNATCEDKGEIVKYCKWCNDKQTEEIPAKGHEIPYKVEGDPTSGLDYTIEKGNCVTAQVLVYICANCGEEQRDPLGEVGGDAKHTWDTAADGADSEGWVIDTEATCTEEGAKHRDCTACDEHEEETIDALNHPLEKQKTKTVQPNCSNAGYSVTICELCGEELDERVPGSGNLTGDHVYPEEGDKDYETYVKVLQKADCETDTAGIALKICKECGKRVYASIDAEHDYVEDESTIVEPTCKTKGSVTKVCSNCGDEIEDEIDNTDEDGKVLDKYHNWVLNTEESVIAKAPCGDSTKVYDCSLCNGTKTVVDKGDDDHDFQESMVKATCTENAKAGEICTKCGEENPDAQMTDLGSLGGANVATGHSWTEWKVVTPASCDVAAPAGSEKLVCANCGIDAFTTADGGADGGAAAGTDLTRPIEKPDHEMDDSGFEYVAGDCETQAMLKYHCEKCNKDVEEPVQVGDDPFVAGTHDWDGEGGSGADVGWTVTKAASCTEKGSRTRTCTKCHKTVTEDIAATGHNSNGRKTIDATCKTPEYTQAYCTDCNENQGDPVQTPGSNPDENAHVYYEPGDDGFEDYASYYNEIQKHTQDATGVARVTCAVCGAKSKYVTSDHVFDEENVTLEPTCTAAGTKTKTCSVCGKTEDAEIEATGHSFEAEDFDPETAPCEDTAPTCGEKGKKVYTCTHTNNGVPCTETKTEEYGTATGVHDFEGEGSQVFEPATCEKPAQVGTVCAVCGIDNPDDPVDDFGEKLGHMWGAWETVTKADCHEDDDGNMTNGSEKRTCERQGCKDAETGVAAVETRTVTAHHTPGESKVTSPTCTENGKVVTKCSVCEAVIESEDLFVDAGIASQKAQGHNMVDDGEPATCKEPGWEQRLCSRCGQVGEDGYQRRELPVDADAHVETQATLQDPSCSETGVARKYCSECGKTLGYVSIDKLPHTLDGVLINEDGMLYNTCTECGAKVLMGVIGDPDETQCDDGHTWGDSYVDEEGNTVHACTVCGTLAIVEPAGGDEPDVPDEPGDETCEHEYAYENETNHKCGKCNNSEAHKWSSEYPNEDGTAMMKKCSACNHEVKVRDIQPDDPCKDGHDWQTDGTCSRCEATCTHSWNATTGECNTCQMTCKHSWNAETGKCNTCQMACSHSWNEETGKCDTCGMTKPVVDPDPDEPGDETCKDGEHQWNATTGKCGKCGTECVHDYQWVDSDDKKDSDGFPLREEKCSTCGHVKENSAASMSESVMAEVSEIEKFIVENAEEEQTAA